MCYLGVMLIDDLNDNVFQDLWKGSPTKKLEITFSQPSNRHITSDHEIPRRELLSLKVTGATKKGHWTKKMREAKWRERGRKPKHVIQEENWRGSPSTYRHLTFSASTNLHLHNEQDLPKVIPLAARPPPKRPITAPDAKYKRQRERQWQRIINPKDPDLLGPALSPKSKLERVKLKHHNHRISKGEIRPILSPSDGATTVGHGVRMLNMLSCLRPRHLLMACIRPLASLYVWLCWLTVAESIRAVQADPVGRCLHHAPVSETLTTNTPHSCLWCNLLPSMPRPRSFVSKLLFHIRGAHLLARTIPCPSKSSRTTGRGSRPRSGSLPPQAVILTTCCRCLGSGFACLHAQKENCSTKIQPR